MIFGQTTSEHCTQMCKLPYLSENSCDTGLSWDQFHKIYPAFMANVLRQLAQHHWANCFDNDCWSMHDNKGVWPMRYLAKMATCPHREYGAFGMGKSMLGQAGVAQKVNWLNVTLLL